MFWNLCCLSILPCRHSSSSGSLGLLDHPERDSELPLNLLFPLGDITVGMKGLNSQPSFELVRRRASLSNLVPQSEFDAYFLFSLSLPPAPPPTAGAAPHPQPRAYVSIATLSQIPGPAGSSEPEATGGAGQRTLPLACPGPQMELEAGPHPAAGLDHPGCFSGRARTWLLSKSSQALVLASSRVPGLRGLPCRQPFLTQDAVSPPPTQLPQAAGVPHIPALSFVLLLTIFRKCTNPLLESLPDNRPPSLSLWFSNRGPLATCGPISGCHTGGLLLAPSGHRSGMLSGLLSCMGPQTSSAGKTLLYGPSLFSAPTGQSTFPLRP